MYTGGIKFLNDISERKSRRRRKIVSCYCHLHPSADPKVINKIINIKIKILHLAGADSFVFANNKVQDNYV